MLQHVGLRPLVQSFRVVFSTACLAMLAACGGSSGSPATPSTPCVQTTVLQGNGQIPATTADVETFTTTATGRVDVNLDWTSPATVMGLAVAQNPCTFDQLKANTCTVLLNSMSPPKPLKASIQSVSPGTYVLFVGNTGSVEESITLHVVLSSGPCPAASSTAVQTQSFISGIARNTGRRLHP
jgi:hypothetical protein